PEILAGLQVPQEGSDFFVTASKNAHGYVHPDDLADILKIHDKENILKKLEKSDTYSVSGRLVIDGKVLHARFITVMCEDKKHVLCCMENIDDEVREKEEQERNLKSAERMARRDELTGIKNKNAFGEYSQAIDAKIKAGTHDFKFALLVCDMNDLKLINDTRGHNFGDEALQRTSRMICDVYKHSPVFRIGGDEFVAVLTDYDYERREDLLKELRTASETNGRMRSGPQVASGLAAYNPMADSSFDDVFARADSEMYENKKFLKARKLAEGDKKIFGVEKSISEVRRRMLNNLFGSLYTVAGGGYVFLNDIRSDYSRCSLPFLDDFGLESEYLYHAEKIWQKSIHPDDVKAYREAIDKLLNGESDGLPICYRAKKADGSYVLLSSRTFVLTDGEGKPDFFGGIMIEK
ncbi:MAG: diguanylate cyclase, partial [Treponema sp.]|nr:diguanylate cyclase [Treponema sp.]